MHWAPALESCEEDLFEANQSSIAFIASLREEFAGNAKPIVLNGIIGPRGDGYSPTTRVAAEEAEEYHARQISWLAGTEVDMVTAMTLNQSAEAIGLVRAARAAGLPVAISFTVETDGRLPSGEPLGEAIRSVDGATDRGAAYFMVNCAHPDHFSDVLDDPTWTRRIRGLRCNASRLSHAELDECESLDDGDPAELGRRYQAIQKRMPWLNIFGGCCGSDLRHVTQIASATVHS
jgi:homocysteine S-methyltransferase